MTEPADIPIRDAATVVLLRDGVEGGIEAWLLTRVTQMAFAAGMTVFPGGRVDDADAELPFVGNVAAETAAQFGCDEKQARALLGAAVRETFEETGVLLTAPPADLSEHRTDVEAGAVGFAELLREHELTIDASGLRPWSRWITPAGESRRYDTRFFVGALPDGAEAKDVTTESSSAEWVGVGEALEQAQRGERKMLPPTLATLASIVPFETVAEVIAAARSRDLRAVRPNIRLTDDGNVVADLPDGTSISLPRTTFS
ncbi:MAG TPA: NUDIX domain-containing protein [Jatrophihabitantaceae bacterium]|jgi:8-oxo-dGTP pyrophosphatase MutT (NUDIX family)|nr:NUDIX domain-containing protein [Jatrophihabitantaceae bacterium]